MKIAQTGRSMVEMLGVLAIIGVLSVGGIAGYSKAMLKYKLNKQSEQLNQIFNTAVRYYGQIKYPDSKGSTAITNMFDKMGEIPKEMIRTTTKSNNLIYDVFNNSVKISVYGDKYESSSSWNPASSMIVQISLQAGEDDINVQMCRNIINVAKENHHGLWYLETISGSGENRVQTTYWGDRYCGSGSGVKCITGLDVSTADAMCRGFIAKNHTSKSFNLWIK